jgi:hypothetical protein
LSVATLLFSAVPGGAADDLFASEFQHPAYERLQNVEGYCNYVKGTSDAERALLLAPELFGSGGLIQAGGELTGDETSAVGTTQRFTVGAQYNFVGLYQAMLMRRRADDECRMYQARSRIHTFLQVGPNFGMQAALEARLQVLASALEESANIQAEVDQLVEAHQATVEEQTTLRLRRDLLLTSLAETRRELELLASATDSSERALHGSLREYLRADASIESNNAALRRSAAWGVNVRGGYDQILGYETDMPAFAQVTVSMNLGTLFQGRANRRAAAGRRDWVGGQDQPLTLALRQIRSAREAGRQRLQEAVALADYLDAHRAEVSAIAGANARKYVTLLWFESVRLRAEEAFLRVHLPELDRFLDDTSNP